MNYDQDLKDLCMTKNEKGLALICCSIFGVMIGLIFLSSLYLLLVLVFGV